MRNGLNVVTNSYFYNDSKVYILQKFPASQAVKIYITPQLLPDQPAGHRGVTVPQIAISLSLAFQGILDHYGILLFFKDHCFTMYIVLMTIEHFK